MADPIHDPAVAFEILPSPSMTVGVESPQVEQRFRVVGTDSDVIARAAVEVNSLPFYEGILPFKEYTLEYQGGGIWEGRLRYAKRQPRGSGSQSGKQNPANGSQQPKGSTFQFEIGLQNVHKTQSIQTVSSYAASGSVPNCQGAIGVNGDSVEGVDVEDPVFTFSETHYLPVALVTTDYLGKLSAIAKAPVNDAVWRGYDAGSVRFLGCSGSQRDNEDWEVTFRWSVSPTVTGLQIGSITGINKDGWDYLWVRYIDSTSNNALVKVPAAVYVERVYNRSDYAGFVAGTLTVGTATVVFGPGPVQVL